MDADFTTASLKAECEAATRHVCNMLWLGGKRASGAAIIELLRSAPRTPDEAIPSDGFFCRCVMDAAGNELERKLFEKALSYFDHLRKMPSAQRAMLEACVIGTFLGFGMAR